MKTIMLLLASFFLTDTSSSNTERTYLCKCQKEEGTAKTVYIFFVESTTKPSCCNDRLLENYPGFKEVWNLQHGKVWALDEDKIVRITPDDAFNKGCSLENKQISATDIIEFPNSLKKYRLEKD